MSEKTYTNGEVTVIWKPDLCIHSGNCVRGLPNVFKPGERPWIQMDGASTEQIIAQVGQCPSGALSIRESKTESKQSTEAMAQELTNRQIEVFKDGPVKVDGPCTIKHSNGEEEVIQKAIFLCRCGASSNKPFCDGTHRKAGFTG